MANLSSGDLCLVTFVAKVHSQTVMNTFPYRVNAITGTPTVDDALEALYAALADANDLVDKFLNCVPPEYVFDRVWLQVIAPTRRRKVSIVLSDIGQGDGVLRTANVQTSISRYGDTANRRNIGGIRIPLGQDAINMESGTITADMKANLQLLATQMLQPVTTTGIVATWIPQVGTPAPGNVSVPLVATEVQTTVRVIRRRTVGRGI